MTFQGAGSAGVIGVRSHDSQAYRQRFMLRFDETTAQKLQALVTQFGLSRAEIIRQLVAQATLEAFPPSLGSWPRPSEQHEGPNLAKGQILAHSNPVRPHRRCSPVWS